MLLSMNKISSSSSLSSISPSKKISIKVVFEENFMYHIGLMAFYTAHIINFLLDNKVAIAFHHNLLLVFYVFLLPCVHDVSFL